jgi:energy-coupling factor transporter ATP-binding protein EcfA2
MKDVNLPSDVYLCIVAPGERPDFSKLHQSILMVLKRHPDRDQSEISCKLYWCGNDQPSIHLGDIVLFPISEIKDTVDSSLLSGEIVSAKWFEERVCEFAMFLGARRFYRALIDYAGRNLTKRLLIRAHDLAALQAFAKGSRALRYFREHGWLSGVLRGSEEQFTFLAFEKILNEDQIEHALPPNITSVRADLKVDHSSELEFTADYSEVLGEVQPINVIIGANGAGKTRLLLALAQAARVGGLYVKGAPSRWSDTGNVRPSGILSFTYEPFLWSAHRRAGVTVVKLGVGASEWRKLTSVIQELALADHSSFQIPAYVAVIRAVVDPETILIPISRVLIDKATVMIKGKSYLPLPALCTTPRNLLVHVDPSREIIVWSQEINSHQLSSGQRSLLLLTAQLFLNGERALVLLDEPENHLHPQYITLLMRILRETLIAMESRAVIITHSPFVVRELDKAAVQILDRDSDSLPCLYQTSLQTFGGDVGQISEYVFGDQDIQKGYEVLIQRALDRVAPELKNEVARRVLRELGDDAELYLQKIMNDEHHAYKD